MSGYVGLSCWLELNHDNSKQKWPWVIESTSKGREDSHHYHLTRKSRIFLGITFKTSSLTKLPFSPGGPTLPGRPGAPFSPFSPASPVDTKVNEKKKHIKTGLFYVSSSDKNAILSREKNRSRCDLI